MARGSNSRSISTEGGTPITEAAASLRTIKSLAATAVKLFHELDLPDGQRNAAPLERVLKLLKHHTDAAVLQWECAEERADGPVVNVTKSEVAVVEDGTKVAQSAHESSPAGRPTGLNPRGPDGPLARHTAQRPDTIGDEWGAKRDQLDKLIWQAVESRARTHQQICSKLELLGTLIGNSRNNRRDLALISSIRDDVEGLR